LITLKEDGSSKILDAYPPKDIKLAQEGKLSNDVGPLPAWLSSLRKRFFDKK